MSESHLKAFQEQLMDDRDLQHKLKSAADIDAVFTQAREAGLMISAEDYKRSLLAFP